MQANSVNGEGIARLSMDGTRGDMSVMSQSQSGSCGCDKTTNRKQLGEIVSI